MDGTAVGAERVLDPVPAGYGVMKANVDVVVVDDTVAVGSEIVEETNINIAADETSTERAMAGMTERGGVENNKNESAGH